MKGAPFHNTWYADIPKGIAYHPFVLLKLKFWILQLVPPPRRRLSNKFYQGLLRREEDERTVKRRAGKPGVVNG
jgi:hypothetical protein